MKGRLKYTTKSQPGSIVVIWKTRKHDWTLTGLSSPGDSISCYTQVCWPAYLSLPMAASLEKWVLEYFVTPPTQHVLIDES